MGAFATAKEPFMAEAEYLASSFESDMDFVDGHLEERNVGEIEHANWQRALMAWFLVDRGFPALIALPEVRIKVSEMRYRVPDIAVFARMPAGAVVMEPPLAVFEILSPEDRYSRLKERFRDYHRMGIPNLFAIERREEYSRFQGDRFEPITEKRSSLTGSEAFVDWAALTAMLL